MCFRSRRGRARRRRGCRSFTGALVKERARRLRERGALALQRHLDAEVGATRRVLAETGERGRTEQFTLVQLATPAAPGAIVEAQDRRRMMAGNCWRLS